MWILNDNLEPVWIDDKNQVCIEEQLTIVEEEEI